jgi:malonate transporter and related proteins
VQTLIAVVLPVFLVVAVGYVTVWRGIFSDDVVESLMAYAQKVAIPCLLFYGISRLDLAQDFDLRLLSSFFAPAIGCFLLGVAGGRLIFKRPWEDAIVIGFCCLYANTLMLALPITERAYGPDAVAGNYAISALHAPICYIIGITSMEILRGHAGGGRLVIGKIMRGLGTNPVVIGVVLGFAANLSGLRLPVPIQEGLVMIAVTAIPVALFGLGGVLSRYKPEGDMRTVAFICLLSLVLHPVLTWAIVQGFALDTAALRSAVVTAAVAPGANAYVFANMYGRARRVAASSVLIGTALSVISLWFWLTVLP